jgi:hypothetical protein
VSYSPSIAMRHRTALEGLSRNLFIYFSICICAALQLSRFSRTHRLSMYVYMQSCCRVSFGAKQRRVLDCNKASDMVGHKCIER